MLTEVCLTVDTEFNIGGTFENPAEFTPIADAAVRCEVAGKEQGLGLILDTLQAHAATATFFVEALNSTYFGDAPMRRIAHQILAAGHDVQLHLHPCWLHFARADWRQHLATTPNDSCAERSRGELDAIIGGGLSAFERWNIPRPIAIRAGNLKADRAFYRAAADFGIRLASNIGLSIFQPRESELQLRGGRRWIDGVLELPILTYADPRPWQRGHLRSFTITGTSWAEMRWLLWEARKAKLSQMLILTHPTEFIKQRGFRFESLHRNRINQRRLEALLRFIRVHDQDFVAVSFRDRAKAWLAAGDADDCTLKMPTRLTLSRMVENGLNDRILGY